MYEFIKGTLVFLSPTKAVVDVRGIGFSLDIPYHLYIQGLPIGEEILFYTAHVVREDSVRLFGFATQQERDLFLLCSDVSGIGPKTALNLVGHMSITELRNTLQSGNVQMLSKIPGIGKKTAERLIIEMRDRIDKLPRLPDTVPDLFSDAITALMNLGYSLQIAQKAVRHALPEGENNLSTVITKALQHVG